MGVRCMTIPNAVTKVAPIAVYTSGKGSSAAGLTASVQRDSVSVSEPIPLDTSHIDHLAAGILLGGWCHGPCGHGCCLHRRVRQDVGY